MSSTPELDGAERTPEKINDELDTTLKEIVKQWVEIDDHEKNAERIGEADTASEMIQAMRSELDSLFAKAQSLEEELQVKNGIDVKDEMAKNVMKITHDVQVLQREIKKAFDIRGKYQTMLRKKEPITPEGYKEAEESRDILKLANTEWDFVRKHFLSMHAVLQKMNPNSEALREPAVIKIHELFMKDKMK